MIVLEATETILAENIFSDILLWFYGTIYGTKRLKTNIAYDLFSEVLAGSLDFTFPLYFILASSSEGPCTVPRFRTAFHECDNKVRDDYANYPQYNGDKAHVDVQYRH